MKTTEEKKANKKAYHQRPEVKERSRDYGRRPEVKARRKVQHQQPEYKERERERSKIRRQRPGAKERFKVYQQQPKIRDYHKNYKLQVRYGLTTEAFDSMFVGQGDVCAVCETSNWGLRGPTVDHNHATGAIRGILCDNCNTAIGRLKDNSLIARVIADYLERA
jgi:hypothetical protein